MRMDSSGDRKQASPLTGERNATPSSRDLAQFAQAEHLESAGIGEDRPVPAHESDAIPPCASITSQTRPQPEVKGIAEHDLRPDGRQIVADSWP